MNVTVKNIPDEAYRELKQTAAERGRSLNAHILVLIDTEVTESLRRRRMREQRKELDEFVASLPELPDSVPLIREDRDR
jgi:hypothetical protein